MNIALSGFKVAGNNSEIATSPEKVLINNIFSFVAVHIACIIILGLAVYSNTFSSPLVFDDEIYIQSNPALKNLTIFTDSSLIDSLPNGLGTLKEQFRNRILGHFTFALNYQIHGFSVTGYHMINLLIHLLNALLVYLLVVLTFRTPFMITGTAADSSFIAQEPKTIAFLCALLFVAHPVQTQAVTYIAQRFTSLVTLFYLLSIALYIKARLSERSLHRWAWGFAALVSVILAMKTKEISFTLPAVIALYELMFFEGRLKKRMPYLLPFLLTMAIIPATLILSGSPDSPKSLFEVSQETTTISRYDYLFTQFSVITTYIRLLFLPVGQNLDYDYPVYNSFFMPQVCLPFLFLLSVFALAIYLFCRSRKESASAWGFRLISFGILYFFITLSVESSVIPIKDVIFEHRAYLPSFGFFLCFAVCIILIKNRLRQPFSRVVIPALLIVAITLAGAAYARNAVWCSPLSLWQDVVNKSPMKARGHNNLGNAHFSMGDIDAAVIEYQSAISIEPTYDEAHYNMGIVYLNRDHLSGAAEEFRAAIESDPGFDDAYLNLGVILYRQNRPEEALAQFLSAIEINPANIEARYNLAEFYEKYGRLGEAAEEYSIISGLDPDNTGPLKDLGFLYKKMNRLDEAIESYLRATRIDPSDAGTYLGLGICYMKKKDFDAALRQFRAALALDPDYQEARQQYDIAEKRSYRPKK